MAAAHVSGVAALYLARYPWATPAQVYDALATTALACTAYTRPGDREHFLARGFDHYIAKPFTREQLLDGVKAALARRSPSAPRPPRRMAAA